MRGIGIPVAEQVYWFKWLRYYLDFCQKYIHPSRHPETELLYLQKLSSKGQTDRQQQQASDCICLFRKVAKRFPAKGKEQDQAEPLSDWGEVLVGLDQEIHRRQYAKTTIRQAHGKPMIYTQTVPSRTWKERKSPLDMGPEAWRRGELSRP